ncbi:MAG: recombinase family protein [Deltaproteobacteria bacterium]|nr:recombinase family protein [Deltaproteobacteria bacterium]
MEKMDFDRQEVSISCCSEIDMATIIKGGNPITLIIGWGLSEKPRWIKWAYEIKTSSLIKQFIAVDLYESHGVTGRVPTIPNVKEGAYWRHTSWQTNCKIFLNDFYVSSVAPYGMTRIPKKDLHSGGITGINLYKLAPGLSEEIEIIHFIFNLFVDHGYTLTEICNLLIAQGVMPPNKNKTWTIKKIKTMVESAVYIGSNQYGACLKKDVFPALIDRSTFRKAQAKIYQKKVFVPVST